MTDTARPIVVYTDVEDTDPAPGIALLEANGFEVRVLGTRDRERIIEGSRGALALLPGYAAIDAGMMEALPELQIVALMSMGSDQVDVPAASARGVWVTNVPAAATEEVATHTVAIMLHTLRQLRFYLASANPGRWNERAPKAPWRLSERTLGLIGLGRIGREVARQAGPLFGGVVGYDPMMPDTPEVRADLDRLGIRRTTLADVQSTADVLSLHLPLTEQTHHMVDAAFLAGMPDGAVLVNVSRGGLVDSHALAAALDRGHLSGAALDVLDAEPPASGHPLVGRADVTLTPHIAYFSERTEVEYVRIQAQNVVSLFESGAPDSAVNQPRPRN